MYERAVALKPSYMAYSNLGTAYGGANRYQDAVKAYRKALELDDKDWMVWGNLAYVYAWMGMAVPAAPTFARAIELAEAARKESPRDEQLHCSLATYYAKTNQPRLAVERLETAIALSPGVGTVQASGAEVYEQIGQREKAIEFAREAIDLGFPRQRLQRNPELSRLVADPRMHATP